MNKPANSRSLFRRQFLTEMQGVRERVKAERAAGYRVGVEEIECFRWRARVAYRLCREAELGLHGYIHDDGDAMRCITAHHTQEILTRDLIQRRAERDYLPPGYCRAHESRKPCKECHINRADEVARENDYGSFYPKGY